MNESTPPPMVLSPAALPEAPRAQSLRLVAFGVAPVLLASGTQSAAPPHLTEVWALPLAGAGPAGVVATVPQLLPVPPRWDAAPLATGALSFVLELAGGAVNALFETDGKSDQRRPLTVHRPFGSFSGPRFVRGADPAAMTVSAILDNDSAVVLTGAVSGTAVEHPIGACIDVVVIGGPAGSTAVCKRVAPGAARGGALPGTVRVFPLDAAYEPAGPEVVPFGERRLFEMDADRAGGGLVVVATTGSHLLLAHRTAPDAAFRVLQVDPGGADPRTFSAPCVVVTERTVTVAVLSGARTPDARALVASWSLDAPP